MAPRVYMPPGCNGPSHPKEMLKNAVLAFFSSQSENAVSALG